MTRTFLIAVNLEDGANPTEVAADILEDLVSAGYDATSCRMWTAPVLGLPSQTTQA